MSKTHSVLVVVVLLASATSCSHAPEADRRISSEPVDLSIDRRCGAGERPTEDGGCERAPRIHGPARNAAF